MSDQDIRDPLEHLLDKSQMLITVMRTVIQATDIKPKKLRVTLIDEDGEHKDITLHELMQDFDDTIKGYKGAIHGITQ